MYGFQNSCKSDYIHAIHFAMRFVENLSRSQDKIHQILEKK